MGSMRIAVNTRALTPAAPNAELNPKLLITVANIPIWSPFTRSNLWKLRSAPGRCFHHPITIPICTPRSCISLICCAYSPRRFFVYTILLFCPSGFRPLSFSRILLNLAILVCLLVFCKDKKYLTFFYLFYILKIFLPMTPCITPRREDR